MHWGPEEGSSRRQLSVSGPVRTWGPEALSPGVQVTRRVAQSGSTGLTQKPKNVLRGEATQAHAGFFMLTALENASKGDQSAEAAPRLMICQREPLPRRTKMAGPPIPRGTDTALDPQR